MPHAHSPAPWIHDETWGLIMSGDVQVCALHSGVAANARLIAAAPDLLIALDACKAWLQSVPRDKGAPHEDHRHSAYQLARSAIAKATEA